MFRLWLLCHIGVICASLASVFCSVQGLEFWIVMKKLYAKICSSVHPFCKIYYYSPIWRMWYICDGKVDWQGARTNTHIYVDLCIICSNWDSLPISFIFSTPYPPKHLSSAGLLSFSSEIFFTSSNPLDPLLLHSAFSYLCRCIMFTVAPIFFNLI